MANKVNTRVDRFVAVLIPVIRVLYVVSDKIEVFLRLVVIIVVVIISCAFGKSILITRKFKGLSLAEIMSNRT